MTVRNFMRPRFSLWAMLVLISIIAIPLGYVAQRRGWNLKRKAAYEQLTARQFQFQIDDPVRDAQFVTSTKPAERPGYLSEAWSKLCLEDASPRILSFGSAQWTHSARESKPQLRDDDLKLLAKSFPEIRIVDLFLEPQITDDGLASLARISKLKSLNLYQLDQVNGEFLDHFPETNGIHHFGFVDMPNLRGPKLARLAEFVNLRELNFTRNPGLSDETLEGVQLPEGLNLLALESDRNFERTLSRWLPEVELVHLDLNVRLGRSCAPALATQSKLVRLEITNAPFVDEDFAFLSQCEELDLLQLECMPIEGAFLASMTKQKELRELSLRATLLNDRSLPALKNFANIESLQLDWTPILGEGFSESMRWPKLQELSLVGCRFSELGKEALSRISIKGEVRFPSNWSVEDMKRYSSGNVLATFTFWMEQPGVFKQNSAWGYHLPKTANLSEMHIDRCPAEALSPVQRLLEAGYDVERRWDRRELPPR